MDLSRTELLKKAGELLRRQGKAEKESLALLASLLLEQPDLLFGFHPRGDDPQVHAPGKSDDRDCDSGITMVAGNIFDEGAIDFEVPDRWLPQTTE
jgi:hypothetical protein